MATISQINIDGSTYDILDAKLKNTITSFYDSDTKSISLSSTDNTPAITVRSPVFYSNSDTPPNSITGTLIQYNDNTGQRRAYITHVSSTNGRQGIQLRTCKFNSNNELIYNPLDLFIDSNGVDTVYVAYPDAWRSGFGFGTDITTDTISEIITPFSGITFNFARYRERHGIALLELSFKRNSAISVPNHGNFPDINIGTLVSGKRPILATHARSNGDEAGQAWFHIDTAGKVILCTAEGTGTARTIAANINFNLSAMYIVA